MSECQDFCLRWSSYSQQLSEALKNLLDRELLVDVTLACDGRSLRAHRAILSACSSYFQDLFQENTHPHPIIILKDVRYQELEALVKFMYHGEVTVNHDVLPGFLRTAETLHIRGLTDGALSDKTTSENSRKNEDFRQANNRRSGREDNFRTDCDENATRSESFLPCKRIKPEQQLSPPPRHHSQDMMIPVGESSREMEDDANVDNQAHLCLERSDELPCSNPDQYNNLQRPVTTLDGLSHLVMPVLQDDASQSGQFIGLCQNMSGHQTQPPLQSSPGGVTCNNNSGGRPFRQRVLYNTEQLVQLESWYRQDRYPSGALMREYADTLASMAPTTPGSIGAQPMRQNVDYWFQNRRRKDSHPEVMQQREKKKLAKTLWGNYNSNSTNSSSESNSQSSSNHYSCSGEAPADCAMLIPKPVYNPDILHHEKN